jgi:hypothetical protein
MRQDTDLAEPTKPPLSWALAAMALMAIVPFLAASIPSMTDLPGHVGRYAVMLDGGRSPYLASYYQFEWRLVGNLGVDLLVQLFGPLFGVERAAWLVAAGIAPLTIAGIAATSRALHGRIEPGALLAGCFVLANPLMFGFVNYCLSFALALLSFAAWVALRERRWWVQAAATAPLVFLTWLAHAMGWGVLLLMVAGFEAERLWRRRSADALGDALLRGIVFLPPMLATVLWRGGAQGVLYSYGTAVWKRKIMNWIVVLRGEAKWIDIATPVILAGTTSYTLWRRIQIVDPRAVAGGVLLLLATFAMPMTLMGSWGADERLVPAAVIALLLSLRWTGSARSAVLAAALALALFGVRVGLIARDWHRSDADYAAALASLDHVPRGARIHTLVLGTCRTPWQSSAWNHLAGYAMARRDALVNTQWYLPGATLLKVVYPVRQDLAHDPSQQLEVIDCAGNRSLAPLHHRLTQLDGRGWDYVWILRTGGQPNLWPGHAPIRTSPQSALFRIDRTR